MLRLTEVTAAAPLETATAEAVVAMEGREEVLEVLEVGSEPS